MKGIIFGNYFINIYFSILLFYSIVTMFISPLNKTAKAQKNIESKNGSEEHKIRNIIHLIVFLTIIISGFYFVVKYQIIAFIYFFYIFGTLLYVVIVPYVIWGFIHYIFVKPFDFELTDTRKNILGFTGYIMVFVCGVVTNSDTGVQVSQLLSKSKPTISDFIMISLLTIWYFSVIFFSLTLLLLSLHDIYIWVKSRIKVNKKRSIIGAHVIKDFKYKALCDKIVEKIDTLPKVKAWRKMLFYIIWFICIPVDLILGFMTAVIDTSWKLIDIIIFVPIKLIRNAITIISKSLSRNQGKTVILISRVALVGSLIIVYLIDKYQRIFTEPGSEIYEFMCSVIIIPLIITQIIELNNKQHNVDNNIYQEP